MVPAELAKRAKAGRYGQKAIAQEAKLDKDTVERAFNQKTDPLNSTVLAIEGALKRLELRDLERLIRLHGCRLVGPTVPGVPEARS